MRPITEDAVDEPELSLDDIKVCNCARCGKLLTDDPRGELLLLESGQCDVKPLAGRVDDRPFCSFCIPIPRSQDAVAMNYHNHRTPRQRAKMGNCY